jgi:hypothetical protein
VEHVVHPREGGSRQDLERDVRLGVEHGRRADQADRQQARGPVARPHGHQQDRQYEVDGAEDVVRGDLPARHEALAGRVGRDGRPVRGLGHPGGEQPEAGRPRHGADRGRLGHDDLPVHERMDVAPQQVLARRRRPELVRGARGALDHLALEDQVALLGGAGVDRDVVVDADVQIGEANRGEPGRQRELFDVERVVAGRDVDAALDGAGVAVERGVQRRDRVRDGGCEPGEQEHDRPGNVHGEEAQERPVEHAP